MQGNDEIHVYQSWILLLTEIKLKYKNHAEVFKSVAIDGFLTKESLKDFIKEEQTIDIDSIFTYLKQDQIDLDKFFEMWVTWEPKLNELQNHQRVEQAKSEMKSILEQVLVTPDKKQPNLCIEDGLDTLQNRLEQINQQGVKKYEFQNGIIESKIIYREQRSNSQKTYQPIFQTSLAPRAQSKTYLNQQKVGFLQGPRFPNIKTPQPQQKNKYRLSTYLPDATYSDEKLHYYGYGKARESRRENFQKANNLRGNIVSYLDHVFKGREIEQVKYFSHSPIRRISPTRRLDDLIRMPVRQNDRFYHILQGFTKQEPERKTSIQRKMTEIKNKLNSIPNYPLQRQSIRSSPIKNLPTTVSRKILTPIKPDVLKQDLPKINEIEESEQTQTPTPN